MINSSTTPGALLGALAALRFLVSFTCVACAVAILVCRQDVVSGLSPALVIWVTFLALLLIALVGFCEARRVGQNPWIAPVPLITGYYFFRYGWGSVVAYYWDQLPFEAVPDLRYDFMARGVRDNTATACPLMLLSGIGLYLGSTYLAPLVSRKLPVVVRWVVSETKLRRSVVSYAPIGLLICGLLRFMLPVEIRFTVLLFGSISSVLLVIVSYWCFNARTWRSSIKWGTFLAAYTLGSALLGLGSGMVGDFLHPLIYALLGYVLARRTYPWRFLAMAVPLGFLFVFPWLTIFKYYGQPRGADLSVGERVANTESMMSWLGYRACLELAVERSIGRLDGSWLPAIFVQHYPAAQAFEQGRTFLLEASGLVPRILWPEKPDVSNELNRYSKAVGIVREGDDSTSAVFDAVSEYYVNFGLVGVAILSLVHGCYLGVLYHWLAERLHYVIGASIFLVLFFENSDFFGIGQLIVSHVKIVSVWLLLFYCMSSAGRNRVLNRDIRLVE